MNKLESACYLAEADEAPFDKLHEECGVFGIYRADSANKSVVAETYHALYALQHRGQESCGIVVNDDGVMKAHKDNGLVTEVFTRDALSKSTRARWRSVTAATVQRGCTAVPMPSRC